MRKVVSILFVIFMVVLTSIGVRALAQSANILTVQNISSDCTTVYLNDAAGTILGPYTNQIANGKLQQAISKKTDLAEQMAQEDAQIVGAEAALDGIAQCVANQKVSATNTATSTGTDTGI